MILLEGSSKPAVAPQKAVLAEAFEGSGRYVATVRFPLNDLVGRSLDGVAIERDIGDDLPPVQVDTDYISRILADLLAAAGTRTGVGDRVVVSTEVRAGDAGPGHLVVLIQGGSAGAQDAPSLEEDENIRSAVSLAEDAGGRIWMERQTDGSNLICFLLPVVEESGSIQ